MDICRACTVSVSTLHYSLFIGFKCSRKLNYTLGVFLFFIVSKSCWRIKDTIIERLGSFLVFYHITMTTGALRYCLMKNISRKCWCWLVSYFPQ